MRLSTVSEVERVHDGHGAEQRRERGTGTFSSPVGHERRRVARAPWQPVVEFGVLASVLVLLTVYASRVFGALSLTGHWWILPIALALGVAAADFGSGVVHWIGDRCFQEDTPIIGPMLIQPFREHHRDPTGITRHGLLELHGNTGLPVGIVLALAWWLMPEAWLAIPWLLAATTLLLFVLAGFATNQLHMWAHMDRPPRLARWLHRSGLVLTPDAHARHHANDFRTSYCITTGWSNPLLDRIDFFGRLERSILRARRV